MKKLIILFFCVGFGCQSLMFAQDYEQTKKILESKYSEVYYESNDGWFQVKQNHKAGACDLSGKEIIPCVYDQLYLYEGHYCATLNNKRGICSLSGKEIITCKYDQVVLQNGYYSVKLNNKEGACNLSGIEIIPCKYDRVILLDGYYSVTLNNKEGTCDLSGKEIVPCKYDQVILHADYYSIKLNNKEGVCDLSGKEIVPCIYDNLLYSGGFNYKDASGNWVLIADAPRLPKDGSSVASISNSSSEARTTAASITSNNTTKATLGISKETNLEDMSFLINNHYAKQSNDYTKLHLISFTDKNAFEYTILDVLTSEKVAEHRGTFQYNDGKVVVILTDNTILRFSLVKLTPLSIGLVFENSILTKYSKWFSPEDLFTTNSTLYWKNVRSGSATMNTNTNIETYSGQQPKRVCAYCNGTGKKCVLKTVPTYGTHSYLEKRCKYCGQVLADGVVHVLQTCTMCNGTGYR